jgi:hypothetical protein
MRSFVRNYTRLVVLCLWFDFQLYPDLLFVLCKDVKLCVHLERKHLRDLKEKKFDIALLYVKHRELECYQQFQ